MDTLAPLFLNRLVAENRAILSVLESSKALAA